MWYNGAGGDFLTHLLVVDDEVSILELIKNSLGKDGYLITVCQNADDVDIKKLHFYDLILLDVMMPGIDGFTLCREIRVLQTDQEYGRLPDSLSDRKDIRGRYIVWIGHRCG